MTSLMVTMAKCCKPFRAAQVERQRPGSIDDLLEVIGTVRRVELTQGVSRRFIGTGQYLELGEYLLRIGQDVFFAGVAHERPLAHDRTTSFT